MSESIARYYDASKNADGGSLPGVPLADLTEEQFESYPVWVQLSIDASPMYRRTKPPGETAPAKQTAPKADKE